MQAKAEAAEQMAEIKAVLRETRIEGDDQSALREAGLGASAVKATNGADRYITLYHAYDGREIPLPSYMVQDRLTRRFDHDSSTPPEYRGKQVWLLRKPAGHDDPKPFMCRLHVDQAEEVKAEMLEAGFQPNCHQISGYRTQFEADEHFRKRHPRRWTAYERHLNGARQAAAITAASGANSELAEVFARFLEAQSAGAGKEK